MSKININVYTNLNNIEDNNDFLAIKKDNVIEYIDLENNKMVIDLDNDILIKENNDYCFNIDFRNEKINIKIKKLHRNMIKDIKTLNISRSKKKYSVKYLLTDDNIINEYYVNF